jgi:hypothetical protein
LTVLAHTLARAVYEMLKRDVVFALDILLQREGRGVGAPAASRGHAGRAWQPCSAMMPPWRRRTPMRPEALCPAPARLMGRLLALRSRWRKFLMVPGCCPSPEPGAHWHIAMGRLAFAEDSMRVQRGFEGADNRRPALCHRHRHGGSPSIRVWCSHMSAVPAKRNQVRTRCQRRTTPGSLRRKKHKIRSEGTFVS